MAIPGRRARSPGEEAGGVISLTATLQRTNSYARRMHQLVYFQQNAAIGATEEYLFDLISGVNRDLFSVALMCPNDLRLDGYAARVEALGITVTRYPTSGGALATIRNLHRLFGISRPSIVHFNDPCTLGLIAARASGHAQLVMTHHTPLLNRRYNLAGKALERLAFRCGQHVIFSSEVDRRNGIAREGWREDRTTSIQYGIRPDLYGAGPAGRNGERPFTLGHVARLSPQKGHTYLFQALEQLKRRGRTVHCVLVGDGESSEALRDEVKSRNLVAEVAFAGFRRDVAEMLREFDLFVMPSLFEGLCYAVLEASASSLPVIATRAGGVQFAVADGETGMLVEPGDVAGLAAAIEWMMDHPLEARAMGERGRDRVERLFTVDRMVRETETLYLRLLGRETA